MPQMVFGPVMARTMIGRAHDVKVPPNGHGTTAMCHRAATPFRKSTRRPVETQNPHRHALLSHANHESEPRAVRAFRNDVT
jgi:hypothetical protein